MYRYVNTRHGYFQLGKARSSITATNKQLHDYDAENCQLKARLAECEAEVAARFRELDTARDSLEQSNIEHSSLLTHKERQIAQLEARLEEAGGAGAARLDWPQDNMVRCISEDNILELDSDAEDGLLERQLAELTAKLDRMETEMVIVSEESGGLQTQLEIKEATIVDQVGDTAQHTTLHMTQHTRDTQHMTQHTHGSCTVSSVQHRTLL